MAARRYCSAVFLLLVLFIFMYCSGKENTSDQANTGNGGEAAGTPNAENPGQPADAAADIPASQLAALIRLDKYVLDVNGQTLELGPAVQKIAAKIEADSVLYNSEELSDCSGIFHRVLLSLKKQSPGYDYPNPEQFRDTRDLARWYHQHGDLLLIKDALADADLIKPGAVLFFGHRDTVYMDFTAEDLFGPRGIEHMGVVVSVEKDADGKVSSYKLFHGQTYGKIASVTNHHKRKPTRANLPPLGNSNQQWVAFARIVNPSAKLLTRQVN